MNYREINLEKGMYAVAGKTFSQVLEELDPSSAYADGGAGLDAFGRQLKRFDISVSGSKSDCVCKFFASTQSAALFPEYISRAVRQGMEEADLLGSIVASRTAIDGLDYRTITASPAKEDDPSIVGEGAEIPETTIKTQDNLVRLHKRGRMLVASYEAVKFQRLDLFTVTLKQIGAYIARRQFSDAVETLISGDGNNNAAPIAVNASGSPTYAQLVELLNSLSPYEMTTLIASPAMMSKMLELSEFKNPVTGINFAGTGSFGHPLGAQFVKSPAAGDKIIGLDRRCALEMITAGDIDIDYDRLIDRQLERASVTSTAGFAKIFPDSCKLISVSE